MTSEKAYDAACDRFDAISSTIADRRAEFVRQIQELDAEYDDAQSELARHEDYPGIPLWDRCPTCRPTASYPFRRVAGHPGPCRGGE